MDNYFKPRPQKILYYKQRLDINEENYCVLNFGDADTDDIDDNENNDHSENIVTHDKQNGSLLPKTTTNDVDNSNDFFPSLMFLPHYFPFTLISAREVLCKHPKWKLNIEGNYSEDIWRAVRSTKVDERYLTPRCLQTATSEYWLASEVATALDWKGDDVAAGNEQPWFPFRKDLPLNFTPLLPSSSKQTYVSGENSNHNNYLKDHNKSGFNESNKVNRNCNHGCNSILDYGGTNTAYYNNTADKDNLDKKYDGVINHTNFDVYQFLVSCGISTDYAKDDYTMVYSKLEHFIEMLNDLHSVNDEDYYKNLNNNYIENDIINETEQKEIFTNHERQDENSINTPISSVIKPCLEKKRKNVSQYINTSMSIDELCYFLNSMDEEKQYYNYIVDYVEALSLLYQHSPHVYYTETQYYTSRGICVRFLFAHKVETNTVFGCFQVLYLT